MRFIEVPYLEKVPYPMKFGPVSDKPLPPKYKLVSDRRQIIDLDKVVCAYTFSGVLVGDDEADVMSNLDSEFIEFVYGENIKVVTLNPEKYLGLLLDNGTVERNNDRKFNGKKNGKFKDDGMELPFNERKALPKYCNEKETESWN